MSALAAPRQSGSQGWTNHIPSDRLKQARRLDRDAQAYLMHADDLRKDRPYFTERPAEMAGRLGVAGGPNGIRGVQRLEKRLEAEGLIHRVLIRGRRDAVSGRETVTGRIAVIPLVSFSKIPIVQGDMEIAQLEADLRDRAKNRRRIFGMVARQPCRPPSPGCTTDLSAPIFPTGKQEQVTTTSYGPESGQSSSTIASLSGTPAVLDIAPQEASQEPRTPTEPEAEGPPPGVLELLLAFLTRLMLTVSPIDSRQVAGRLAEELVDRAASKFRGGLRWVAWAIFQASKRKNLDRSAVRWWSYVLTTLRNWQQGDGEPPPEGWPALTPEARPAAPARPTPRHEDPPPDRTELDAMIAELEAKSELCQFDRNRLERMRAERAKLDAERAER